MKIVVRSGDIENGEPAIIAFYEDHVRVSAESHGQGMKILTVPSKAIDFSGIVPKLAKNWRAQSEKDIVAGEAEQRIDEVLPLSGQISTLRETIELVLQHGMDVSSWPTEAKTRKAEIDDKWNYVRDVRDRARAMKSVPGNPTSDKLWPTRVKTGA